MLDKTELKVHTKQTTGSKVGTGIGIVPGLLLKWTLEGFGAAGAIWGCSDFTTIRGMGYTEEFRAAAYIIGTAAFLRQIAVAYEEPRNQVPANTFFGGFSRGLAHPYKAIKTQFMSENAEEQPLLEVVVNNTSS